MKIYPDDNNAEIREVFQAKSPSSAYPSNPVNGVNFADLSVILGPVFVERYISAKNADGRHENKPG